MNPRQPLQRFLSTFQYISMYMKCGGFFRHFCTGWRRPIGCLQLQVSFHKRATNYRALLQKMTYTDKASYESSPACTHIWQPFVWRLSLRTLPRGLILGLPVCVAVCCSVLQCVAAATHVAWGSHRRSPFVRCSVCCSVLQCVAVRVVTHIASGSYRRSPFVRCSVRCSVCCSMLRFVLLRTLPRYLFILLPSCVAVCFAVCVAVCCSVPQFVSSRMFSSISFYRSHFVCCSVLQCVAVCCSVLQCVAVWFHRPSSIGLYF